MISTAFSTGGRISEVLMLKRKNFIVFDKYVAVVNMPVIKRWKKTGEVAETRDLYDKPTGKDKDKWHLVPERAIRALGSSSRSPSWIGGTSFTCRYTNPRPG